METKQWNDELNTGIPLIDIQHKTLFDLINYFVSMDEKDLTVEKISFIMESLENYIKYHFATEVKFFEKCNYDNKELNFEKHSEMITVFADLKLVSDETKYFLIRGFLNSLNLWLNTHILVYDFDYIEQLKNHLKNGSQ